MGNTFHDLDKGLSLFFCAQVGMIKPISRIALLNTPTLMCRASRCSSPETKKTIKTLCIFSFSYKFLRSHFVHLVFYPCSAFHDMRIDLLAVDKVRCPVPCVAIARFCDEN